MRRRWLTAVAAVCLGGVLVPARVRGEDKPPDVPPEMVAKFTAYLKKISQAQRPRLDARMSGEIAEVAKVTGLGADGVKSLEAAAGKAEDAAQDESQTKVLEVLRKQYAQIGAQGFAGMDQPGYLESTASTDLGSAFGIHYTPATEQPAWTGALARALSPEQAAAWEKARAERRAAVSKDIENFLDGQTAQYHEMLARPMRSQADEIISWLDLPKERAGRVAHHRLSAAAQGEAAVVARLANGGLDEGFVEAVLHEQRVRRLPPLHHQPRLHVHRQVHLHLQRVVVVEQRLHARTILRRQPGRRLQRAVRGEGRVRGQRVVEVGDELQLPGASADQRRAQAVEGGGVGDQHARGLPATQLREVADAGDGVGEGGEATGEEGEGGGQRVTTREVVAQEGRG